MGGVLSGGEERQRERRGRRGIKQKMRVLTLHRWIRGAVRCCDKILNFDLITSQGDGTDPILRGEVTIPSTHSHSITMTTYFEQQLTLSLGGIEQVDTPPFP